MMYLIYNRDGSIKLTNLNEVITQGSTTTKIFVHCASMIPSAYTTAIATYKLPNGETSVGNSEISEQYILGETYSGWLFSLTQDETYYYGTLLMSIKIYRAGTTDVLFTIPVELTINKTGFDASTTTITITQYTNLVSSINTQNADFESRISTIEDAYVNKASEQTITGKKVFNDLEVASGNFTFDLTSSEFVGKDGDTSYTYDLPEKSGTLATTDDVDDAKASFSTPITGTISIDSDRYLMITGLGNQAHFNQTDFLIFTYGGCFVIIPVKGLSLNTNYYVSGSALWNEDEEHLGVIGSRVYEYFLSLEGSPRQVALTIRIYQSDISLPEGYGYALTKVKL